MSTKSQSVPDPAIKALVERLVEREVNGDLLDVIPALQRLRSERDAYRAQAIAHGRRIARVRSELAGYKIAATTRVMQRYLGMDTPCSAVMLESLVRRSPAVFDAHGQGVLGVECEIAVRLGRDLLPRAMPYTTDEVADAVDACFAAIEVVEDRYVDWRAMDARTLIADNFFHLGAVLGPPNTKCDPRRLDEAYATMTIDGTVVGEGKGSDVLGHPLMALVWLADQSGALGEGLREGQVILLGSLVQTNWVAAGSKVSIANNLLGFAEVEFGPSGNTKPAL